MFVIKDVPLAVFVDNVKQIVRNVLIEDVSFQDFKNFNIEVDSFIIIVNVLGNLKVTTVKLAKLVFKVTGIVENKVLNS